VKQAIPRRKTEWRMQGRQTKVNNKILKIADSIEAGPLFLDGRG